MDLSERIIPPLREGVVLEESAPGARLPFAAVDRALGQKIKLDQRGAMLASVFDRPWTPVELFSALEQHGVRVAPQLLVQFVRFMDAHCLLATERAHRHVAAMKAADEVQSAHPPAIRFLEGSQHDCAQCGASCGGHDIGPISAERRAAIEAVIEGARFIDRDTGDPDTTGTYCAMQGDLCVYLRADKLCRIHAAEGAETKPIDCRVFPLAFTATPDGVVAGLRMECREYIASKRRGGRLAERAEELAHFVSRIGTMNEVPPLVRLDEAVTLPYAEYLELEASVRAVAEKEQPALWAGLLATNDRARALIDRARDADRSAWVFPPSPPAPSGVAPATLVATLVEGCTVASELNAAAGNTLRALRFERVARAADKLGDGPLAAPALGADDEELIRDHLCQSLLLKEPLMGPHLRFGLALLSLSVLLAVAGLDEAEHLNASLADALKTLRAGPIRGRLHKMDDAVADHFHDRLEVWVA